MKRKWSLKRQCVERNDGQRRWDQAYQLLIQMTPAPEKNTGRFQAEFCQQNNPLENPL